MDVSPPSIETARRGLGETLNETLARLGKLNASLMEAAGRLSAMKDSLHGSAKAGQSLARAELPEPEGLTTRLHTSLNRVEITAQQIHDLIDQI